MPIDAFEPGLTPQVALLFGQIKSAHWRLRELVSEMSPAELAYAGPTGRENSTLTLLQHLSEADLDMSIRYAGVEAPPALQAEFGPRRDEKGFLPAARSSEAGVYLARLEQVHGLLRERLAALSDADLSREIKTLDGVGMTLRFGLWHMAEHSMMHQGQIRVLRRQFSEGA